MVLLGDEGQLELCSVHLEIVVIMMQDRYMVCAKRTQWNSQVMWVVWNLVLVRLETMLV
jgi:hypothetical protein